MIIPIERLNKDVLQGIVESYISREGTDYGAYELSMEEKVDNLMLQVKAGSIVVVYDEITQSVNLLPKYDAFQTGEM
ncbi:hypothetical protein TDB9533_02387 [Thalassocella blandensis]|nr:hypothetical protein TDB9533_02387 [Thalassocella blandensis]